MFVIYEYMLNLFREDFRKAYKEKHPNNKSVAVVSILISEIPNYSFWFVCYNMFDFAVAVDCLGRESWRW